MGTTRRGFLKVAAAVGATGIVGAEKTRGESAHGARQSGNWMGVLVDLPKCIGCRKCEYACEAAAGFNPPPMETFEDKSVFQRYRRPQPHAYTTVNRFPNPRDLGNPLYVKTNCLHCNDPACASACLVGALRKRSDGPVVYESWKCMGCRYCMVACPFQIPTYEYDNALAPQVRKCNLCADRVPGTQEVPSCVQICPVDCMTYGKRSDLLDLARQKIRDRPDVYVEHIYGEHEVGGTSWLYLSSRPFEELGFLKLGSHPPPRLTESIQHGVFKYWMPPLALYGLLGMIMHLSKPDRSEPGAAEFTGEDQSGDG